MAAISRSQVTDERVTGLRIYADAEGETHMEDIDIGLLPRRLFKDNPPFRLTDNFAASWCNICYVPAGRRTGFGLGPAGTSPRGAWGDGNWPDIPPMCNGAPGSIVDSRPARPSGWSAPTTRSV
jgi:hypothetical protein